MTTAEESDDDSCNQQQVNPKKRKMGKKCFDEPKSNKLKRGRGRPRKQEQESQEENMRDEASSDGEILVGAEDVAEHAKKFSKIRNIMNIKKEKK